MKIIGKTRTLNGEQYLEVQVVDTGVGIKDEDKPKLFKMFGYIQDSE